MVRVVLQGQPHTGEAENLLVVWWPIRPDASTVPVCQEGPEGSSVRFGSQKLDPYISEGT